MMPCLCRQLNFADLYCSIWLTCIAARTFTTALKVCQPPVQNNVWLTLSQLARAPSCCPLLKTTGVTSPAALMSVHMHNLPSPPSPCETVQTPLAEQGCLVCIRHSVFVHTRCRMSYLAAFSLCIRGCAHGGTVVLLHRCRVAEKLASMLGTPADLPSRAGSAMLHALSQAAGANGHTYLQWNHLRKDALRLMSASGAPPFALCPVCLPAASA